MNALSSYVRDVLEPTWQQTSSVPSRINRIAHVLQHNSSLSLDRVIPGGSYEKGTMLRHRPDVDMVLVFNKEPGVKRNWQSLMNRVCDALSDAYPNAEIKQGENIAIHTKFEQDDECNFDIVPSFSVNSPMQMAGVKTSKIYQGISSLWHLEYIKPRKNLRYFTEAVRLLKDWKNEHNIPLKSFHMELIAAFTHHWLIENRYGYNSLSLEAFIRVCFLEIQGMTIGNPIYPVDWKYFDATELERRDDYPLLIDPANPTNNLLENLTPDDFSRIRQYASRAITLLDREEYGQIFDPQNQTQHFDGIS
jgi:tRNA nucleotidyltransferase (CCA-adding enzyme)